MSDRIPEGKEPQRKSSKRTQRYQQTQVEQPNKRLLLKAGLGLLGLASFGGLAAITLGRRESATSPKTPVPAHPTITVATENLSPEALTYQAKLSALNHEIRSNPNSFKEIAPKVTELALEYFLKEMQYDKSRYNGKFHFHCQEEYTRKIQNDPDCIDRGMDENTGAASSVDSEDIEFNLTNILRATAQTNLANQGPAFELFAVALHELHHATPPIIKIEDSSQNKKILRGLTPLIPKRQDENGGYVCSQTIRIELEEAIVEDSNQRMLQKLGLISDPDEVYKKWIRLYRQGVIDRLFNGDNKPLLNLQQQSKDQEFFSLVGQKLGFSTDQAAKQGESYLARLLTQGI